MTTARAARPPRLDPPQPKDLPPGSPAQYLSDAVQLAKALGGTYAVRDLPEADPTMPLTEAARHLAAAAWQLVHSSLNDKKATR